MIPVTDERGSRVATGSLVAERPAAVPSAPAGASAYVIGARRRWRGRLRDPRALLWGFVGLHGAYAVAMLPWMLTGTVLGDLPLYREWALGALDRDVWPGLDGPWVYPIGALAPVVLPAMLGPAGYLPLWLGMLTALNGLALWVLTDGGRRRSAIPAAWFWLATLFLLAPVSMLRLEGVTGPLVIIAFALLRRHPAVAGALLAVATWIKVWPAAVVAAALLGMRRRGPLLWSGLAVTAAVAGLAMLLGASDTLWSFLATQDDRALQVEAPIATPWVWAAVTGLGGTLIYENLDLETWEVVGPGARLAADLSTLALVAASAVIAVLVVAATLRARRLGLSHPDDHLRRVVLASFAFVAALIVCNKVGSPQYVLWLAAVVVAGLAVEPRRWVRPAIALLVTAALTTLVFPVLYLPLVGMEPLPAVVLTGRNLLLVGFLVWSLMQLWAMAFPPAGSDDAGLRPLRATITGAIRGATY